MKKVILYRISEKSLLILFSISFLMFSISCNKEKDEIKYAKGYPNKLAGNWIVFEFPGGDLGDEYRSPYYMVTALDPNNDSSLVLDNLYNANLRIKTRIKGDTGFFAFKTQQLEVTGKGDYDIERISIEGYINNNDILIQYVLYPLAVANFPNMSFSEDEMTEVIFFHAGFYNKNDELIDTVMVMGYRMTGFENVEY
jgi:hypothetical protein